MTSTDDRTTVLERYDHAIGDKIVIDPNHRTSAEYIIASGMSQANSLRNRAAISLHRLRNHISGDDTHALRAWCVTSMVPMWCRPPHKMRPSAAHAVFEIVLHWYLAGTCNACSGRRFELIHPDAQVVGTTPCRLCDGLGKEPVAHRLPKRYREPGRWLADEMASMVSDVEREMAARLRG